MPLRLLLCTDLDRTLLPNGAEPESPDARLMFRALVERPEVSLAYVTGRDRARVENAIDEFHLPFPDHVIADVGTTIYDVAKTGVWARNRNWDEEIGHDWASYSRDSLALKLAGLEELRLQEASRQSRFKLSYYVSREIDADTLSARVRTCLDKIGIKHSVIYSVDGNRNVGLLDVLPAGATKRHAIEFIMSEFEFTNSETVFCGDSGNDLSVLASNIPGVLVANASAEVRRAAIELSRRQGNEGALYIARGSLLNLNGNYSGGILEGVAHFYPDTLQWMPESSTAVAKT